MRPFNTVPLAAPGRPGRTFFFFFFFFLGWQLFAGGDPHVPEKAGGVDGGGPQRPRLIDGEHHAGGNGQRPEAPEVLQATRMKGACDAVFFNKGMASFVQILTHKPWFQRVGRKEAI